MSRWDFRSVDADEVQQFLSGVYTENEFKVFGKSGPSRTRIYGGDLGDIAQYNVSYSSPFTFLSETDRDSFLIISCTAGSVTFSRGRDAIEFRPGCVAPISATRETRAKSGNSLAHISTLISAEAVTRVCSKLLGNVLDGPVLLEHVPFSHELKSHWELIVRSLGRHLDTDASSSIAINGLVEHAIALLLEKHPHNYSKHLQQNASVSMRVVQDAKRYMEQNADQPITLADVATFVRCSMRALHKGFCEHVGITPRAYLHFTRMSKVRASLEGGVVATSAVEVARKWGFTDYDSFSASYAARYKETPGQTFRRHSGAISAEALALDKSHRMLTPAKMDLLRHHINSSLGDRLTVEKLAALVGMSAQSFAAAFKLTFKTTPAQYVLSERLKWARWLLANTDISISAVAAETGFSSQSHLTAVSRRLSGETPYEVRRTYRFR